MKIQHSFYELISKRPIQSKKTHTARQGALLQVEFDDGTVGYADCHPWVELGDLPLQTQLDLLKSGRSTRLTARSIYFAKADAEARANKYNLLASKKIPISHYLISELDPSCLDEINQAWNNGFTHFKLKLGKDLVLEETLLKEIIRSAPKAKLRLDFNSKLTQQQFISFLDRLSTVKQAIDFVEDPFPFDYVAWRQIQETYQMPLAADEHYKVAYGHPEAARVLIMKPAIQTLKPIDTAQRLIITSYLDHPLGQVSAAYMAALAKASSTEEEPCGLLSHYAYQANPFAQLIQHQGPYLQAAQGYGFGFDELLKKQKFVSI